MIHECCIAEIIGYLNLNATGEQGGYNIPEVVAVPEISEWLDENNLHQLLQWSDDKDLPEYLRRILCDGYMCMYQSTEVMMYK